MTDYMLGGLFGAGCITLGVGLYVAIRLLAYWLRGRAGKCAAGPNRIEPNSKR